MLQDVRQWLGIGTRRRATPGQGHDHGTDGHGHTHGVIDPTIASTARGIWAIKWSFVVLALTAAMQLVIVLLSGSVALLADTIHNVGDAVTAIPLWVAFILARRRPSRTFTYGLGRVEDIAGVFIVAIILFSALVAGNQAIQRLIDPQPISHLGWVIAAGVVGFLGNEAVAVFRIRVGREISSAALVADGYHARTDGFTSLVVVLGALGVWAGFPLADPIIGLLITLAIFGIVWQSARAVLTGLSPNIWTRSRMRPGMFRASFGHTASRRAGSATGSMPRWRSRSTTGSRFPRRKRSSPPCARNCLRICRYCRRSRSGSGHPRLPPTPRHERAGTRLATAIPTRPDLPLLLSSTSSWSLA